MNEPNDETKSLEAPYPVYGSNLSQTFYQPAKNQTSESFSLGFSDQSDQSDNSADESSGYDEELMPLDFGLK